MQQIDKVYWHWSATTYGWNGLEGSPPHPCYHTTIDGNGKTTRHVPYSEPLFAHTYARNRNSVAIGLACMFKGDWKNFPPTDMQIDSLAKETAKIALAKGWQPTELGLRQYCLTHAEAAGLRDYPEGLVLRAKGNNDDSFARSVGLPHANYGPSHWRGAIERQDWPGGPVDRWDLWMIKEHDPEGSGGYRLRLKTAEWMLKIEAMDKR